MSNEKWEKLQTSPTWDFKKDNELIGTFMEAESEVGPNKSNLYTFKEENGSLIAVWGNTILDGRFKSLEKGDKIKVIFKGKAMSPTTKREYNDFDVFKAAKEESDVSIEKDPEYEKAFGDEDVV